MSYTYAYLVLDLLLGLVWLALFFARKDLSDHIIGISLITAPQGLTQYWFYQDYWRPAYSYPFSLHGVPFGFENFAFAFFVGGICGVIYETVFRKAYRGGKKRTLACLGVGLFGIVLFLGLWSTGLSSIWASALAAVLISCLLFYLDKDLRTDSIVSAILMFFVISGVYIAWLQFFPEAFARFWPLAKMSGVKILGIPVEELVWYSSWGMFGGIFYEFWINAGPYYKLSSRRVT